MAFGTCQFVRGLNDLLQAWLAKCVKARQDLGNAVSLIAQTALGVETVFNVTLG